jgi:glycosyltransferase involved in cell wall biosynthesis
MPPALSILVVTNIYPTLQRPTLGMFVEQQVNGLRGIGLKVRVLFVNRAEEGLGVYFRMRKPWSTAVAEASPALLHVMYGGVMADRVMGWNSTIPKVVTFHGSDLLGENLSGRWRKWLSRYGVHCSRRAARKAQGVVVVSEGLRKALPRGLDESRVRVIPCGIDQDRFQPADKVACQRQLGWREGVFHVLFASNNGDPVKRPWLASAAVEALKGAGVHTMMHFMHGVPYAEVPMWLNASDALIMTSVQEGSPTVVKEALACGVPVVSVDVGDVGERIKEVVGCHLSSPEPEELAAKLMLVRLANGRVRAQNQVQELSVQRIAHRLERFYRETLSLSSQPQPAL